MLRRILASSAAATRLKHARAWLSARAPDAELIILGGSPEGASDLSRFHALSGQAAFGWHRLSLRRLALRLAERPMVEQALAAATSLSLEAVWARVVHQLAADGTLGRFASVGDQPGLPRALARTVDEVRLAGLSPDALDPDLAVAARAFEAALTSAGLADRARVLQLALAEAKSHFLSRLPMLMLDVEVTTPLERALISAVAAGSPDVLATVPAGDERTRAHLGAALGTEVETDEPPAADALTRLQQHLFRAGALPEGPPGHEVAIVSAPGELRECVEVARLLHQEARRGVPFDQMAVLLRAPGTYRAPIAEALRRAGIPAHCTYGTRAPDPAGRALLALLACAEEGLSASRFAEYLSLGEVPKATPAGSPPPAPEPSARFGTADPDFVDDAREMVEAPPEERVEDSEGPDQPVVSGGLRAPRKWEQLLVDAAVIGGRDRWERRLNGLGKKLQRERAAPDVTDGNAARLDRALSDLKAFRDYALPLLDLLAALPASAPWNTWLDQLSVLAARSLRKPDRVHALLSELAPLGPVGPVGLREVRRVLSQRLLALNRLPMGRRFGKVFVGPVDAARGMAFDVVFVPGLAERIFPQKVREDPIAPDAERKRLGSELQTDAERVAAERLQLQLAVGAARTRIVLSYPRIDVHEGRPRVPSFYGLEALRAAEGTLPRYEELRRRAERAVEARIGWPAPRDPSTAIDVAERDLSVLDGLFRGNLPSPKGAARYLTQGNPFLVRALRTRYQKWQRAWTPADGFVKPQPEGLAALAPHQLDQRSFSPTALQHFAACPYRFFLSAVVRLAPREEPAEIEELDPLQRGSIVHEVHYEVLTTLRAQNIPLDAAHLDQCLAEVDRALARVAAKLKDEFAPAIESVWQDGLVAISADVREWLRRTVDAAAVWEPWKYELAFGLPTREQQDPQSQAAPAVLDSGVRLRGSIDLVERRANGALRATDYKTGKPRADEGTVLGGGRTLQPVLYALALEKMFPGSTVEGGRLYYCTQAGGYSEVFIPLDAPSRAAARQAVDVVGKSLAAGFLPAAPAPGECTWCDYLPICGLNEERRLKNKPAADLDALEKLRSVR